MLDRSGDFLVSSKQIEAAEKRSNQVVFENRPVRVRYVSRAEAEKLGLRKLPPASATSCA